MVNKNYKVIILPEAEIGLQQIVAYLRRTASDTVAKKVQKEIVKTIRKLKKLPASHPILTDISDDKTIYRRILKWSYRIVFTIHEDELQVLVVDIDHGAKNPQELVNKFQ